MTLIDAICDLPGFHREKFKPFTIKNWVVKYTMKTIFVFIENRFDNLKVHSSGHHFLPLVFFRLCFFPLERSGVITPAFESSTIAAISPENQILIMKFCFSDCWWKTYLARLHCNRKQLHWRCSHFDHQCIGQPGSARPRVPRKELLGSDLKI